MNTALIAHWGKSKIPDRIADGLHALGWQTERYERGQQDQQMADRVDQGDIQLVVAMQRLYDRDKPLEDAIDRTGTKKLILDFGFTHHYHSVVCDPRGDNAQSQLRTLIPRTPIRDYGISPRPIPKRELSPSVARFAGDGPFVFVPLQRPRDMVVRLDSSVDNMGLLVQRVCEMSPYPVIVKPHPHDRNMPLPEPDNCRVIRTGFHPSNERLNEWLLQHATSIIGVNSNMLFRAIEYNRPVVATGSGWYSDAGVLHEVDGVEGLDCVVPSVPDWKLRQRYIAACLSRQLLIRDLDNPELLGAMLRRIYGVAFDG